MKHLRGEEEGRPGHQRRGFSALKHIPLQLCVNCRATESCALKRCRLFSRNVWLGNLEQNPTLFKGMKTNKYL
ncbi:hypothetical protein [Mesorhizobium cantuariense]|uniref:Uncharacterized protein n=1 Tax=Mesorhizobium cantuariense TaxID=1300275 RepID=A0ABV7MMY0_9HYPH